MALTGFDGDQYDDQTPEDGSTPPPAPKNPGNRTFLIAIGAITLVLVVALVGMLLVLPQIMERNKASAADKAAVINAQNTATSSAATQVAFEQMLALTPEATLEPTSEPEATNTPVIAMASDTPEIAEVTTEAAPSTESTVDLPGRTATVAALLTQMASTEVTVTPGGPSVTPGITATVLPTTGFADEVGLPGLAGLAVLMIVVIVVARRLRLSGR
jgi:hypothetical protein